MKIISFIHSESAFFYFIKNRNENKWDAVEVPLLISLSPVQLNSINNYGHKLIVHHPMYLVNDSFSISEILGAKYIGKKHYYNIYGKIYRFVTCFEALNMKLSKYVNQHSSAFERQKIVGNCLFELVEITKELKSDKFIFNDSQLFHSCCQRANPTIYRRSWIGFS